VNIEVFRGLSSLRVDSEQLNIKDSHIMAFILQPSDILVVKGYLFKFF